MVLRLRHYVESRKCGDLHRVGEMEPCGCHFFLSFILFRLLFLLSFEHNVLSLYLIFDIRAAEYFVKHLFEGFLLGIDRYTHIVQDF